jgi:hypothetical protein
VASIAALLVAAATATVADAAAPEPKFKRAAAFDVSRPFRDLAKQSAPDERVAPSSRGAGRIDQPAAIAGGSAAAGWTALARLVSSTSARAAATIAAPSVSFEGISNQANFDIFGFRVNPPDPVGDVGPRHYVEMVNLAFAVYDKTGNLLLGPADTGSLWADFPIEDCTDPSGDPIVLYDQTSGRWLLSQFTTRGLDPETPTAPFYNCVAVSKTGDPTGAYYRYAFITQEDVDGGFYFPDYPKYGVWSDSYLLTTRDFGLIDGYGISVYALEKSKMLAGQPDARAVQFFLDSEQGVPLSVIGDGLLPADLDGTRRPQAQAPAPIFGTQDDGAFYGATTDAVNVYELAVQWGSTPKASLDLVAQLGTEAFDSIYPCAVVPAPGPPAQRPNSRDCLPQPGVEGNQYLDILSYRQRPTHRAAYRNFGTHETVVTNQSVEARPGVAGVRWYELRRVGGAWSIHQQGTYAPADGVHRWMASIAQDRVGNMALGYSVVNDTDVFPGIRYTGRLAGDAPGQMTLGEGTVVNGSGVQTTLNSRWGDYTSMNVDPVDDCTFWYVNEYYTAAGQASSPAGWQTRIASVKLPGC